MERQIRKMKIDEFERLRLENSNKVLEKMIEASKSGKPPKSVFVDFSGMKERYLKALMVYGRIGLTARELHEKRTIWLESPGEEYSVGRVKTVSLFLNRLSRAGLAGREREGREYRYFITLNGIKRFYYYRKLTERKTDAHALRKTYEEQQRAALIRSLLDNLLSHSNNTI